MGSGIPQCGESSRLRSVAAPFKRKPALPAALWLRLLGHLSSLEKLVPGGKSRMRILQFQLKEHWSAGTRDKTTLVPVSEECRTVLSLVVQGGEPLVGNVFAADFSRGPPPHRRLLQQLRSSLVGFFRVGSLASANGELFLHFLNFFRRSCRARQWRCPRTATLLLPTSGFREARTPTSWLILPERVS